MITDLANFAIRLGSELGRAVEGRQHERGTTSSRRARGLLRARDGDARDEPWLRATSVDDGGLLAVVYNPPRVNPVYETRDDDRHRTGSLWRATIRGRQYDLPLGRLESWMRDHVGGFRGPLAAERFEGGQSNPTYKLLAGSGEYVLRRKPLGHLLPSAHAVDREYRVMRALAGTAVPVPRDARCAKTMRSLAAPST